MMSNFAILTYRVPLYLQKKTRISFEKILLRFFVTEDRRFTERPTALQEERRVVPSSG